MKSYLLYHKSTSVTARKMHLALGTRFKGSLPKRNRGIYDFVVRWGSSLVFPAHVEINNAEGIRRAANKWATFTTLQEAGLPTVPFSRDFGAVRDHAVVYGRSCYGSGGTGIVLYDPERVGEGYQPGHHDFYTGGIDRHREYRVHVVGNNVIRVQGKYLEDPGADRQGGRVCNHANGYRFKTPQKKLNQARLDDCVAAVQAMGLDFGAVDMVLGTDRKHYILEVNTGPACAPLTLEAYRSALLPMIRERVNA